VIVKGKISYSVLLVRYTRAIDNLPVSHLLHIIMLVDLQGKNNVDYSNTVIWIAGPI